MAVEEHGAGRQMLRFKIWPRWSTPGSFIVALIASIAAAAAYDHSWAAAAILFSITFVLGGRMFYECALAMDKLTNVLKDFGNISKTGQTSVAKPLALRAIARQP
jgi:integral membrane sensor domain MASE1